MSTAQKVLAGGGTLDGCEDVFNRTRDDTDDIEPQVDMANTPSILSSISFTFVVSRRAGAMWKTASGTEFAPRVGDSNQAPTVPNKNNIPRLAAKPVR